MLTYCQWHPQEHVLMIFYPNSNIFIQENAFENDVCPNFVQASMFWNITFKKSLLPARSFNVTLWHNMATEIWVNIGSGNGLLPDGTKPLPESMLTYHQWVPVVFIQWELHRKYSKYQSLDFLWILHDGNISQSLECVWILHTDNTFLSQRVKLDGKKKSKSIRTITQEWISESHHGPKVYSPTMAFSCCEWHERNQSKRASLLEQGNLWLQRKSIEPPQWPMAAA